MDVKARSKPMREILTRLVERGRGSVEVRLFGDKVILDEGMHYPLHSVDLTDFGTPSLLSRGELAKMRRFNLILQPRLFPLESRILRQTT
jgi:hypothetical protein